MIGFWLWPVSIPANRRQSPQRKGELILDRFENFCRNFCCIFLIPGFFLHIKPEMLFLPFSNGTLNYQIKLLLNLGKAVAQPHSVKRQTAERQLPNNLNVYALGAVFTKLHFFRNLRMLWISWCFVWIKLAIDF